MIGRFGKRRRVTVKRPSKKPMKTAEECARLGTRTSSRSASYSAGRVTSQVARDFLNELAPLERLMPALEFRSIEETLIGKPIINSYGS
jgi:hypothetical protein